MAKQTACATLAHLLGEPCFDCHQCEQRQQQERQQQAERARRETEPNPPACLQIPLPNLGALASLPF